MHFMHGLSITCGHHSTHQTVSESTMGGGRNSASPIKGAVYEHDTEARPIMCDLFGPRRSSAPSTNKKGGRSARQTSAQSIGTLLFVDVDGVLNVGIDDSGVEVELSSENVRQALEMKKEAGASEAPNDLAEKIVATYRHEIGHGDATLMQYMADTPFNCCKKMIGRLAELIQMAGVGCTVVLSSSWRMPQHAYRVHLLERALQSYLGKKFVFHERTAPVVDSTPARRLRCIGDFIATKGSKFFSSWSKWRVLLLEDFHIHPLDGWLCDGHHISSTDAAEQYLMSKMPASVNASVRLVHTFSSWTAPSGSTVRIGTGLTNEHFCKAMAFLTGKVCVHCAKSLQASQRMPDLEIPPFPTVHHMDSYRNMEELICAANGNAEELICDEKVPPSQIPPVCLNFLNSNGSMEEPICV